MKFYLNSVFLPFNSYFIEQKTGQGGSFPPDRPEFGWELYPSDNGLTQIRVKWLPNFTYNKPGSHFFAKYRIKGTSQWLETDPVIEDDFVVIHGLQPDETYEFAVVSVDGDHLAESSSQHIPIPENGTYPLKYTPCSDSMLILNSVSPNRWSKSNSA